MFVIWCGASQPPHHVASRILGKCYIDVETEEMNRSTKRRNRTIRNRKKRKEGRKNREIQHWLKGDIVIFMKTKETTNSKNQQTQQIVFQRHSLTCVIHVPSSDSRNSTFSFQVALKVHRKTWAVSCRMM